LTPPLPARVSTPLLICLRPLFFTALTPKLTTCFSLSLFVSSESLVLAALPPQLTAIQEHRLPRSNHNPRTAIQAYSKKNPLLSQCGEGGQEADADDSGRQ